MNSSGTLNTIASSLKSMAINMDNACNKLVSLGQPPHHWQHLVNNAINMREMAESLKIISDNLNQGMNLTQYQLLARRTQCPQPLIYYPHLDGAQKPHELSALLHAAIGIGGESGEINACIQRYFWYNRELDRTNLLEEIGDLSWYIAEACNALGVKWEDILVANIAKLKARYPTKYEDYLADEPNRNREKEQEAALRAKVSMKDIDEGHQ